MEELLEQILKDAYPYTKEGKVATYIPELAKGDPSKIGIYIISSDGKEYAAGNCYDNFTIQSVMKPILLLKVLMDNGEEAVRSKMGVEATGKPFDAINMTDQKLLSEHINPMVNMGAIAMCTMLKGETYEDKFIGLLNFIKKLSGNPDISLNTAVYESEKRTGNKNRALAFLLKTYGMIEDDVEDVLDCYFKACSISINSKDLASMAYVLASHGHHRFDDEKLVSSHYAQFVNAILSTCGMYDGSGDFAIKVGIPAKSGVGGGIMGVVPTRMGIGIFGPSLDEKGNSIAGIRVLEELSHKLYLSVF